MSHRVRRRLIPLLALATAMLVIWIANQRFFYYRDNFSTHYPIKTISASVFRQGAIPYWNDFVGGGQPLAGNPNTLTFYPTNLLYLVLPAAVAFNLHFLLHLLAGGFAMFALLRHHETATRWPAIGSVLYLSSGVVVSATSFYNLVTAVALIPLSFLFVERLVEFPSKIDVLLLGATFGLIALAGEPVTVFAVALCSVMLVAGRLSFRLIALAAAAVAIATIVASPLLISYGEISAEVERAARPYSLETVFAASLTPERLLEMVVGPFRGLTVDMSQSGHQANSPPGRWPPLFPSVFIGGLLLPALFTPNRRYAAAAAVLTLFALGGTNPILHWSMEQLPAVRIVRYPEKLALPLTVVLIVLIVGLLSRTDRSPLERGVAIGAGVLLALTAIFAGLSPDISDPVKIRLVAGSLFAAAACLSLLVSRFRFRNELAAFISIVPVIYLSSQLLPLDRIDPYRKLSPAIASMASSGRVAAERRLLYRLPFDHARARYRIAAALGDPLFGAAFGVHYSLDRSPDGMYSALSRIVAERYHTARPELAMRYVRMSGASSVASLRPIPHASADLVSTFSVGGNDLFLHALRDPLPMIQVIPKTIRVANLLEAVRRIESFDFDPHRATVVPASLAIPSGKAVIRGARHELDRIEIEVEAEQDASIIVNQSFFRAWVASVDGRELSTFPANIDRLGIVIPQGRSIVNLRFGRRREIVAIRR